MPVTEESQPNWWRATVRLAAIALSAFAAVVCVPLLFADSLDRGAFLALPLGTFLIALAAPSLLAVAIFWFADRQRALDHRHGVIED